MGGLRERPTPDLEGRLSFGGFEVPEGSFAFPLPKEAPSERELRFGPAWMVRELQQQALQERDRFVSAGTGKTLSREEQRVSCEGGFGELGRGEPPDSRCPPPPPQRGGAEPERCDRPSPGGKRRIVGDLFKRSAPVIVGLDPSGVVGGPEVGSRDRKPVPRQERSLPGRCRILILRGNRGCGGAPQDGRKNKAAQNEERGSPLRPRQFPTVPDSRGGRRPRKKPHHVLES